MTDLKPNIDKKKEEPMTTGGGDVIDKQKVDNITTSNITSSSTNNKSGLFHLMALHPLPFMIFWPILFTFLIGFGWTQDDIIEDEVNNIWIPQSGDYKSDVDYAASIGEDELQGSSFAVMAIARDNGNLFTANRLEEIRTRMEQTEATTITYWNKRLRQNQTFTWEDMCLTHAGYTYEFPCGRLSPMDLFLETRWSMNYNGINSTSTDPNIPASKQELYRRTWYNEQIKKLLIRPRIPRFAALTENCEEQCKNVLYNRLNETSPGYAPLALFQDIGNLEMSDPCRICYETVYETTIENLSVLIPGTFNVLAAEMQRFATTNSNTTVTDLAMSIAMKAKQLADTITSNDVEDFYFYYVARGVYAKLGSSAYVETYKLLSDAVESCKVGAGLGLVCPNSTDVTEEEAMQALLNHADADFSSITTAGAPFPIWSKADGTGSLFGGTSPVGGSGINMSANFTSLVQYLNVTHYLTPAWSPLYGVSGFADPTSTNWTTMVETNPIYAWFMASIENAPNGTGCGNGFLTGTALSEIYGYVPLLNETDTNSSLLAMAASQFWCTPYNIPNTNNPNNGTLYSKQHFAKMWYDLLISSDSFLGITEGVDDPYSWTTGQGCGYQLRGSRDPYTNMTDETILTKASRELYYIDEGVSVGVISPELLIGDTIPKVGNYSFEYPLQKVGVLQTIYASLLPRDLIDRVKHCKRPGGALDITFEEAEEIIVDYKEAIEDAWNEGWDDDDAGEVQFVSFYDDSGVIGSTGRMLKEITLDNNTLMAISIVLIALFSVTFLFSFDLVASRVLVTLVGISLVLLAYFAAVGVALLAGTKISVTIAWTLPFIILGLGVDDMYIVLQSLKKQGGYSERNFLKAMKEVVTPVTMTSVVNFSMFAILNISDIPAIYLAAQVADYCVVALYCAIVFCYPAYCYLDMRRQKANRKDVCFCVKNESSNAIDHSKVKDFRSVWLYDKFYKPIVLGNRSVRCVTHVIIWSVAVALVAVGAYGITERDIGLGLEDFFPSSNPASVWATKRTEALASWSIGLNWGALDYTNPNTQMKMIKQFEDVVATPHVAEVDTKRLWMADFLMWTTRLCTENFDRDDFDVRKCGHDVVFSPGEGQPNATCSATWQKNDWGLRTKIFSDTTASTDTCNPYEGGICRPGNRMHPIDMEILNIDPVLNKNDTYCPTISNDPVNGWSDDQWQHCLVQWRNLTGYGGRFVFVDDHGSETECDGDYNNDEQFVWPIPFSAGPTMFAYDLFSHQDTLDMLDETRAICDDDEELHCWQSGIPADYWEQYIGIFSLLVQLAGYSTLVGFFIAFVFLFCKLMYEKQHNHMKIFWGSLTSALLISATVIASLVAVVGLSVLAGVSLTGFSNMSFVLSVGFAVEYSVHIVSRWLRTKVGIESSLDRVRNTMSFLMLPTFMSFISSTIGVACLAFTEFEFNEVFFFRPLIIVMFVTYFYGCWWLPAALTLIDCDFVKLGKPASLMSEEVDENSETMFQNDDNILQEKNNAVEGPIMKTTLEEQAVVVTNNENQDNTKPTQSSTEKEDEKEIKVKPSSSFNEYESVDL